MTSSRSPEQNKEIYLGLRSRALTVKPGDVGFDSSGEDPEPYGVLMEMNRPRAIITLAAFVTGDASLYFSSGGGILGGIQHESVRQAAAELVAFSKDVLPHFAQAAAFPGPAHDAFRFYILTTRGIFTAEVPAEPVVSGRAPLSPLFIKANTVITAIREADERRRKP